jgi:DNA-binding MurR/RpiR family transcriptional regulator
MFEEKLKELEDQLTPSERQLAAYVQGNLESIVFETGASLAAKTGVSPNTVSRFLRRLGHHGMRGLKEELRDHLRVQSLLNRAIAERVEEQNDGLVKNLNMELDALASFYSILGTDRWENIVTVVSEADQVFVAGFQTVQGLAQDFAHRLALVRSKVHFLDIYGGVLGPWLDRGSDKCCVIIIDIAPYARAGVAFGRECKSENSDLVLFTDEYGIARHIPTQHIITLATKTGLVLESTGGMTTALNVLLHYVAGRRKRDLRERIEAYHASVARLDLYKSD